MRTRPLKIFTSCAQADWTFVAELDKHLSALRRRELIEHWHEEKTLPGENVDAQVDAHLSEADVILLAISADFLASEQIHETQVSKALRRHTAGVARAVPLILRSAEWRSGPIGRLSSLPLDGKPIDSWERRDDAWLHVVTGIERIVTESRQALILTADNAALRKDLDDSLLRERALALQVAALQNELATLRGVGPRSDPLQAPNGEAASSATLPLHAHVTELTVRLGEALRESEFQKGRAETSSSQRQEQQLQINRLNEELREARGTISILTWKSEAQLNLLSGGSSRDGYTVTWVFAVENVGQHPVRLLDAHVKWCFVDPNESSPEPIAFREQPEVLTFEEKPILRPGERSDKYTFKVDTQDLDRKHAKFLKNTIRPLVRVVCGAISAPFRASIQRLLGPENGMPE